MGGATSRNAIERGKTILPACVQKKRLTDFQALFRFVSSRSLVNLDLPLISDSKHLDQARQQGSSYLQASAGNPVQPSFQDLEIPDHGDGC